MQFIEKAMDKSAVTMIFESLKPTIDKIFPQGPGLWGIFFLGDSIPGQYS
jgi:hypothetical protein